MRLRHAARSSVQAVGQAGVPGRGLPLGQRCQQCTQGKTGLSRCHDSPVWLCSGTSPLFWCRTQPAPRSPLSAPRCTRCGRSSRPAECGQSPRARAHADVSSFLLCCSPAPCGCHPAQALHRRERDRQLPAGSGCPRVPWGGGSRPRALSQRAGTSVYIPAGRQARVTGKGVPQPGPGLVAALSDISGDIKATARSTLTPCCTLLKPEAWQGSKDHTSSTMWDAHKNTHMQGRPL